MAKVLLLLPSGTYRATDFIDAANGIDAGQDLEIITVTDSDTGAPAPGSTISVDFSEPRDAARKIISALDIDEPSINDVVAVVAADDVGVLTAAITRDLLGLPGNTPDAVQLTRDKGAMRQRLFEAGVNQPEFLRVPAGQPAGSRQAGFPFPWVVKPVGLSGSRGVMRVDRLDQLDAAANRARAISAQAGEVKTDLVIERYIDGAEVAVEGMVDNGVFTSLAVFDKPGASSGPYFEETYYVTPSRLPRSTIDDLNQEVARAAAALGIAEGPIHAEARIDDAGVVWILELAARSIGGLCSRSLRFGLGLSLETLILRHALQLPISDLRRESAASGVLMLPIESAGVLEAVNGLDEARSMFGIQGLEITIPVGREVKPLPEGDRYLGFMFARGPSPEAVEETLRRAHDTLEVVIRPIRSGDDLPAP